jgi:hypothetical protein
MKSAPVYDDLMVWRDDDPFGISQYDPVNISRVSFFCPIRKGIKVLLHVVIQHVTMSWRNLC